MKFILLRKRTLISMGLLLLTLIIAVVAAGFTGSAEVWLNKPTRLMPVYSVETDENKVAISFDASWGSEKMDYIINAMQKHGIKATFFCSGTWADQHGEQLNELSESGLFEIGTQGNISQNMTKLTAAKVKLELETSINIIESAINDKIRLFRPPSGLYNDTLLKTASSMGLTTVLAQADSREFKGLTSSQTANKVLGRVKKGSIVFIHYESEATLAALPVIIEGIKNKGLTFVTIGELIYKNNSVFENYEKQNKE